MGEIALTLSQNLEAMKEKTEKIQNKQASVWQKQTNITQVKSKDKQQGTSLAVQWLRFHAGGAGSIPGQGTKIPHAAGPKTKKTKTKKDKQQTRGKIQLIAYAKG